MKSAVLALSLVLAIFVISFQLPVSSIVSNMRVYIASVSSLESIGSRLGQTVHEVVLNIRANDRDKGQRSYLTHAHVLAVMCQENPRLDIDIVNGEGRREGLTQVIPSTARGLLSGQMAGGECAYVSRLENGICANPEARISNPRCSIELGACLYNYELKRVRGDAKLAYNAYNTGRSDRRANGQSDFVRGYNASVNGQLCAKADNNLSVWRAMNTKVAELTGGQFKTDGAAHSSISVAGWPTTEESIPTVENLGRSWWDSPIGRIVSSGQQYSQPSAQAEQSVPQSSYRPSSTTKETANSPNDTNNTSWFERLFGSKSEQDDVIHAEASLLCSESGGKVQLRWSCPSGTTVSRGSTARGERFDTRGAGAGAVTVDSVPGAEYMVQCLQGHQIFAEAKCKIQYTTQSTQESVGDYDTNNNTSVKIYNRMPEGVTMDIKYDDGDIVWSTVGTRDCKIQVDDKNDTGTRGRLRIGIPTQTVLIKLECNTVHGKATKYKKIVVK